MDKCPLGFKGFSKYLCSAGTCYDCVMQRLLWEQELRKQYEVLLERIRQWDALELAETDGPYWRREITKQLYGSELEFYKIPIDQFYPQMTHEQKLEYKWKYESENSTD